MNLDETAASLDALHAGDGDAWRGLYARWQRIRAGLLDGLFTPIPPVKATGKLLVGMRGDGPVRFARFALLPARRMGSEEFGSIGAQRLLAGSALHADLSPDDVLSGFFGWMLAALGQDVGWPVPEGGAGRFDDGVGESPPRTRRTNRVRRRGRPGDRRATAAP